MNKKNFFFRITLTTFIISAIMFTLGVYVSKNTAGCARRFIKSINYQQKILVELVGNSLSAWSKELQQHSELLATPCDADVITVVNDFKRFPTWGAADANGDVICTKQGVDSDINIADRAYVKKAMETKQLTMSGFQVGRVTGSNVIAYAYPVLGEQGKVEYLLFIGIDLEWMNQAFDYLNFPAGSELAITDTEGNIAVYYQGSTGDPSMVGRKIFKPRVFSIVLSNKSGEVTTKGLDNIRRRYFYGPLYLNSDNEADAFLFYGSPPGLGVGFDTIVIIAATVFVLVGLQVLVLKLSFED